jgi:hypothetical protein
VILKGADMNFFQRINFKSLLVFVFLTSIVFRASKLSSETTPPPPENSKPAPVTPAPAPTPSPDDKKTDDKTPPVAPVASTKLVCEITKRLEIDDGIISTLKMGKMKVVATPIGTRTRYELLYTLTDEASRELNLIPDDYFPVTLDSFKLADLLLNSKDTKSSEDDSLGEMEKRQLRTFLDYFQVVAGLYTSIDVDSYSVFSDANQSALHIVYHDKDGKVLAAAGMFYDNLYKCVPLEKAPEAQGKKPTAKSVASKIKKMI